MAASEDVGAKSQASTTDGLSSGCVGKLDAKPLAAIPDAFLVADIGRGGRDADCGREVGRDVAAPSLPGAPSETTIRAVPGLPLRGGEVGATRAADWGREDADIGRTADCGRELAREPPRERLRAATASARCASSAALWTCHSLTASS